ncbi:MAG: tRNA dihydrouridine synthase DusB [Clostridia bacterium]|nr:tRNA dihydrouridine synthase DusB [Clostridia bacterium]
MSVMINKRAVRVCLAPMAGFTDSAMRIISREWGADLTFTEMVSAKAVRYGDKKTLTLSRIDEREGDCILQLFGSEPDTLAYATEALLATAEVKPVGIDINMGCPVNKIFQNGEGSALMKNPSLIYDIVKSTRSATDLPLSVKMRLGVDDAHKNAVECALAAESAGADFITVHGRTRAQMYSGESDLLGIAEVKSALHIPLIASGDVVDGESALRILSRTGADAIMVGRAAIGNPFVFAEIKSALDGNAKREITLENKRESALRQLSLAIELKGEHTAVLESRKQLALYFKGMKGASALRGALNTATTYAEIKRLLSAIGE